MKELRNARSCQDGIIFYVNDFPHVGLRAYYDEDDNIKTETITVDKEPDSYNVDMKKVIRNTIILSTILISISLIAGHGILFFIAAMNFSVFGAKHLFILLECTKNFRQKDSRGMNIAKFHAAEHMVVNAYNRAGRVPTINEIRRESYFSKDCGSYKRITKLVDASFMSSIYTIGGILLVCNVELKDFLLVMGVITVVMLMYFGLGIRRVICMPLEKLVLSKPTDREIKLAQIGIMQYTMLELIAEKYSSLQNKS